MKKDIENKDNVHFFVAQLYHKLLKHDLLKHFFAELIRNNDLEHHVNIITNFWNDILFDTTEYQRNALKPHIELNKTKSFKNEHFRAWLNCFNDTIDENFSGENAEKAKTRTQSIATVMQIKMINS